MHRQFFLAGVIGRIGYEPVERESCCISQHFVTCSILYSYAARLRGVAEAWTKHVACASPEKGQAVAAACRAFLLVNTIYLPSPTVSLSAVVDTLFAAHAFALPL